MQGRQLHLGLLSLLFSCLVSADALSGRVLQVPAGNRLVLQGPGDALLQVRLGGLQLAPSGSRGAESARKRLQQLVAGRQVTVEYAPPRGPGAVPARVLYGGADVNLRLIQDGLARFRPEGSIAGEDARRYQSAEDQARHYRLGNWQPRISDP